MPKWSTSAAATRGEISRWRWHDGSCSALHNQNQQLFVPEQLPDFVCLLVRNPKWSRGKPLIRWIGHYGAMKMRSERHSPMVVRRRRWRHLRANSNRLHNDTWLANGFPVAQSNPAVIMTSHYFFSASLRSIGHRWDKSGPGCSKRPISRLYSFPIGRYRSRTHHYRGR